MLPGCRRHDASKICDHAICSEYDNFPTCCRLEYLAFLDDPEEPVDKGLILLSIFRLLTLLYVTQRHITSENEHISCFSQPAHTIDLLTSRFILSFQRSNLKELNEETILWLRTFHSLVIMIWFHWLQDTTKTPYINYCDPVAVRSPQRKDTPRHRGLRLLLFSDKPMASFTFSLTWYEKMEETRPRWI